MTVTKKTAKKTKPKQASLVTGKPIGLLDQDGNALCDGDVVLREVGLTSGKTSRNRPKSIWKAGFLAWDATRACYHIFDVYWGNSLGNDVVVADRSAYQAGDYRTWLGELRADSLRGGLGGYPSLDQLRCRGIQRLGRVGSAETKSRLLDLGLDGLDFDKCQKGWLSERFAKK